MDAVSGIQSHCDAVVSKWRVESSVVEFDTPVVFS